MSLSNTFNSSLPAVINGAGCCGCASMFRQPHGIFYGSQNRVVINSVVVFSLLHMCSVKYGCNAIVTAPVVFVIGYDEQ